AVHRGDTRLDGSTTVTAAHLRTPVANAVPQRRWVDRRTVWRSSTGWLVSLPTPRHICRDMGKHGAWGALIARMVDSAPSLSERPRPPSRSAGGVWHGHCRKARGRARRVFGPGPRIAMNKMTKTAVWRS